MIIETQGLTKFYGKQRGVVDLDLDVREGEVFGYLGPNGAGKTTTIRLLLDLIRPSRGTARLFGQDVQGHSAALRARVGNLPGELALWNNLSARELIGFLGNLHGGVDWACINRLADRFDLDLSRRVGTFSHGNKQKVGLIQAFACQNDLLILDEPTLGLDPLMQQEFYKLIEETREAGHTVFLSSHVLPEVERVCDRVGIIREGQLVAVEEIAELKNKRLRQLELTFAQPVPAAAFEMPGTHDVVQDGNRLRFFVDQAPGSLDRVLKQAARFEVIDLQSSQATLEDVFLTFYRAAKDEAAGKEGGDVAA